MSNFNLGYQRAGDAEAQLFIKGREKSSFSKEKKYPNHLLLSLSTTESALSHYQLFSTFSLSLQLSTQM